MTTDTPLRQKVLQRALLGLALGALLALAHVRWNLGAVFLIGLCAAAAFLPAGLGLARFAVALAIWAGQYFVYWLRIVAPSKPLGNDGIASILNGIAMFMPAMAILAGTYGGLLFERRRSSASRQTSLPHPPSQEEPSSLL